MLNDLIENTQQALALFCILWNQCKTGVNLAKCFCNSLMSPNFLSRKGLLYLRKGLFSKI